MSKPHNGSFLRAESFFNVASIVDSEGICAPDRSRRVEAVGEGELAVLARGFLDAPERFIRAALGGEAGRTSAGREGCITSPPRRSGERG